MGPRQELRVHFHSFPRVRLRNACGGTCGRRPGALERRRTATGGLGVRPLAPMTSWLLAGLLLVCGASASAQVVMVRDVALVEPGYAAIEIDDAITIDAAACSPCPG